jgi:hypothetical protein
MFTYVKYKLEDQIKNNYTDTEFLIQVIDRESKIYRDFCKLLNKCALNVLCWDLFMEFNDEITINFLNEIIDNEYGNISDECIQYFKHKLKSLVESNKKYFTDPLDYFKNNENVDSEHIKLYIFLQTYFSIGNKYVGDNYKKNPYIRSNLMSAILNEDKMLKLIKYLTISEPYVDKFYDNEKEFVDQLLRYIKKTYDDNKVNKKIIDILNTIE